MHKIFLRVAKQINDSGLKVPLAIAALGAWGVVLHQCEISPGSNHRAASWYGFRGANPPKATEETAGGVQTKP